MFCLLISYDLALIFFSGNMEVKTQLFHVIVLQWFKTFLSVLLNSVFFFFFFFFFFGESSNLLKAMCKILHKTWHVAFTQGTFDG